MDHIAGMVEAVRHRGPDAAATLVAIDGTYVLGHTRLAIRDLTATGAQPMQSASGRCVMVYNGEVYSHSNLRQALERRGVRVRGTSDTELILEHIEAFGLSETLDELNGMYAFAIVDDSRGTLTLVRDRLGIKPLYYTSSAGRVIFASELSAILAGLEAPVVVDASAVANFLERSAMPSPRTVFDGVHQLPPGHAITFETDGTSLEWQYWALRDHVRTWSVQTRASKTVIDEAEKRLKDAVQSCLVSDVPLGVLLSGGVDSSLVTALAVATSAEAISTFSVAFDNNEFDESKHARTVAEHLRTNHEEFVCGPEDVISLVDDIPAVYSEPFADSSQLPMLLLARRVREHVSVVLTGDGGDEAFAGYDRHVAGGQLLDWAARLPSWLRNPAALSAQFLPIGSAMRVGRFAGLRMSPRAAEAKARRLASAIRRQDDVWAGYAAIADHWDLPASLMLAGSCDSVRPLELDMQTAQRLSWSERIQFLDSLTYLPDDLLVKVDRAAMSVGLETRVPLLDHELVQWAWSLPRDLKVRNGQGKWLLREVLARHVPRESFDRPKQGFAVPLDDWLRGPLRDWAEDLLRPSAIREYGLLQPDVVQNLWRSQIEGKALSRQLWSILMLQAWLCRWTPQIRVGQPR